MILAAQFQHVQMTFDGFASLALTDVNLEVGRGEIFGVIGPEGSGKSTLLMLLAGRLRPGDGKVKVFGHSPRRSAIRARIGYLAQPSRRPNRAGLLEFFGQIFRRFKQVAKQPPPAAPNDLRVDQLLLKKPELLVLDEPFTGLAAAAVVEMKDRISGLARQGKTIILSDRWLSPAKDVCGRMAVLHRGQIQATGSLAQLLAWPDAIRILGPVLPPASAERVLTTMREEMLGHPLEPPKPQERAAIAKTGENLIFAALTQSIPSSAPDSPPVAPAEMVNHEKLAQLTKAHTEATDEE